MGVLLMFGILHVLTYGWFSRLYLQIDDRFNIPTLAYLWTNVCSLKWFVRPQESLFLHS
jgi:hypothetical protein